MSIDLCGQLYRCIVNINMCFISGQGWISAQCDLFDPTMMNRVRGRINLYQRVRIWRTFIQKKVKKEKKSTNTYYREQWIISTMCMYI